MTTRKGWMAVFLAAVFLLVVLWWSRLSTPGDTLTLRSEPLAVMGTRSSIVAVIRRSDADQGSRILRTAEDELRRLEALLSTWIDASELSRLNSAAVGELVPLSLEPLAVLTHARELYAATRGAFDVTAGPMIELWRHAAATGVLPTPAEIQVARESSLWAGLELSAAAAQKLIATVRVDVDGVAKGYAIDRAVAALSRAGAVGGMVEVGGDLRVFGQAPDGGTWPVGLRSPFDDDVIGRFELSAGAVCTSGDYARYSEIDGRRYSHIIDPRSGSPVALASSVTVIATDAATADAWATALAVLGVDGLEQLPSEAGIEALLIVGAGENATAVATAGFPALQEAPGLAIERRD